MIIQHKTIVLLSLVCITLTTIEQDESDATVLSREKRGMENKIIITFLLTETFISIFQVLPCPVQVWQQLEEVLWVFSV